MNELYEIEGPLRFCKLTIMGNDDGNELKVRLWLNRIMDDNGYSHYEDYSTGSNQWSMCLTTFEQEQLERYLWENNITNFSFEVFANKHINGLFATTPRD